MGVAGRGPDHKLGVPPSLPSSVSATPGCSSSTRRASNAQLVARAADGALDLVVNQADRWRRAWFEPLERGAVTFNGVSRQIGKSTPTVRSKGALHEPLATTKVVSGQYQLIFRDIYAASHRIYCFYSYAFHSIVVTLKPLDGVAVP